MDLSDLPPREPEWELYTDGGSFMDNQQQKARCAVVMLDKVIESHALSAGISAQKAKIIALTRALELSQGKWANTYTDSKYVFMIAHAHSAI